MTNTVNEPTNYTVNIVTCIDLCVTSNETLTDNLQVSPHISSSHCEVSFEIKYMNFKTLSYKRTIRNSNASKYEALNNDSSSFDWKNGVFNESSISDVYSKFLNSIEICINRHVLTKAVTIRPNDKPFMNNEIRFKI